MLSVAALSKTLLGKVIETKATPTFKRPIFGTPIRNKPVQAIAFEKHHNKTISCHITYYRHIPKYHVSEKRQTKVFVHDEHNVANPGDILLIKKSRKISNLKAFELVSVVRRDLKSSLVEIDPRILSSSTMAQEDTSLVHLEDYRFDPKNIKPLKV